MLQCSLILLLKFIGYKEFKPSLQNDKKNIAFLMGEGTWSLLHKEAL